MKRNTKGLPSASLHSSPLNSPVKIEKRRHFDGDVLIVPDSLTDGFGLYPWVHLKCQELVAKSNAVTYSDYDSQSKWEMHEEWDCHLNVGEGVPGRIVHSHLKESITLEMQENIQGTALRKKQSWLEIVKEAVFGMWKNMDLYEL